MSALLLEACTADRVLILEVEGTGAGLRIAHEGTGGSSAAIRSVSRTVTSKVMNERVTLLSTNAAADPALAEGQSIVLQQIHSVICAPLLVREKVQGLIYLDQERVAAFSLEDLDVVNAVAAQAAIAIENARLVQEALTKERMEQELQLAFKVQSSLIPLRTPSRKVRQR